MFLYKLNNCKIIKKIWFIMGIVLSSLVVSGIFLFILSQIFLGIDDLDNNFAVGENWYGDVYEMTPVVSSDDEMWGNIVLELTNFTSLPEAVVLLNGEPVKYFTEQEVTVRVVRDDVLAVDTRAYSKPVTIKIKSVSGTIDIRELKESITVTEDVEELGKVLLK
jgi:hypothetical protein